MAFEAWPSKNLNLVSDSQYVRNIVCQLGHAVLEEVNNKGLFNLLKTLRYTLHQ